MKQVYLIILAVCLSSSTLLGEINLEPSKIFIHQGSFAFNEQDNQSSFSEVQISAKKDELSRKNPWKAFVMSLVIPGAGEQYAGKALRSKLFFIAEIGLWSSFISFKHLGKWKKDDYYLLAQSAAGANLDGKDDHFFDLIGFYDSREEYNKFRVYDRNAEYFPDNEIYFWNWNSNESRQRYRDLKNNSKTFYRDADFALGLIIANHFLSALDAFWVAKQSNRKIESGFSGIQMRILEEGGFFVSASARF